MVEIFGKAPKMKSASVLAPLNPTLVPISPLLFPRFIACAPITTWLITSSDNGRRRQRQPEFACYVSTTRALPPSVAVCVDDVLVLTERSKEPVFCIRNKCPLFSTLLCVVYVVFYCSHERWGDGGDRRSLNRFPFPVRFHWGRKVAMSSTTKKSSARRSE